MGRPAGFWRQLEWWVLKVETQGIYKSLGSEKVSKKRKDGERKWYQGRNVEIQVARG